MLRGLYGHGFCLAGGGLLVLVHIVYGVEMSV